MTEQCCGGCSGEHTGEAASSSDGSCGSGKESTGFVSEFVVPNMDCPSEERMIRMALDDIQPPVALAFDTPNRKVTVTHGVNVRDIQRRLESLGLGARLQATRTIDTVGLSQALMDAKADDAKESAILKWLLVINGVMFVVELSFGWLAQSTGLIADSLDMFADAAVYGVALYAVGHSVRMKLRAAHLSGWLQLLLALGALGEVMRRFIFGSEPVSALMMGIGALALAANVACLVLIHSQRERGAHMKASWIFSANDVIANLGVMLAGLLVAWTGSRYPDLVIGLVIGLIVLNGARRILLLRH
ncbi:MAG TPA: cation transporter [Marinobacter sp.]